MKHIDGWWCPEVLSGPGKFERRAQVIAYALTFWAGPRRRVIQAGAHIGIFPRQLAQYFEAVVCFEPAPDNWDCLILNTRHNPRIICYYGALGACQGTAAVNVQPHSTGGHHIATRMDRPHVLVTVCPIDVLEYNDLDALFLDIEGYECFALAGGMQTLERCRPLIVAEDNGCSRKYGIQLGGVEAWLAKYVGYVQVGRHGEDSIFVPEERVRCH